MKRTVACRLSNLSGLDELTQASKGSFEFKVWNDALDGRNVNELHPKEVCAVLVEGGDPIAEELSSQFSRHSLDIPVFIIDTGCPLAQFGLPRPRPKGLIYLDSSDPHSILRSISEVSDRQNLQQRSARTLQNELEQLSRIDKSAVNIRPSIDHLLELAPIGIILLDRSDNIMFSNPCASDIFLKSHAELMGSSLSSLLGSNDMAAPSRFFERVGHNSAESFPVLYAPGNGETKHLSFRISKVTNQGALASTLLLVEDHSDIVRAQSELESAQESLSQKVMELADEVELKNRFFSIVAHDLKGPISAMLSLLDLTVERMDRLEPEKFLSHMEHIGRSGSAVSTLLDNLLEWARLQMELVEAEPVEFNIQEVVSECLESLAGMAEKKHICLVDFSHYTRVVADRNMISFVLRNLTSNAIKFTPTGGQVTIKTKTSGSMVEVSVSDTGNGIPPMLFDHLFAVDKKTTTDGTLGEKGTGLGLPLCKEMLELNGGSIHAINNKKHGATFKFTIVSGRPGEN